MWGSIELGAQPVAKPAYSSGSPNWRLRLGAGGAASGSGSVVGAGSSSRRSGSGGGPTHRKGGGGLLRAGLCVLAGCGGHRRSPGCAPGAWACGLGRLGRRYSNRRPYQLRQRRSSGLLLRLLLGRAVPRAQRLRPGEDHRCVLAVIADPRTLAVVEGGLPETLLSHLLQAALEVLVLGRRRQRAVAVEVVVVGGVIAGIQEHRPKDGFEHVGEKRLQVAAAAFGDALSEVEVAAHVKLLGKQGERVGVDHCGPGLGELALAGARGVTVQGR